jgi:hypothetical protein
MIDVQWRLAAWLGALLASSWPAQAAPVALDGITFSDELGGVELHQGSGSGTAADPFVLVEEINDDGPAVLVVRGLKAHLGDPLQASGRYGFTLRKIVTNHTDRPWAAFELELREQLDKPSTYEDGLSFAQGTAAQRSFRADRYARVTLIDEPLDAVVFSEGLVFPGETVTVMVMITDYTPQDEFFLLERREGPVAALPTRRSTVPVEGLGDGHDLLHLGCNLAQQGEARRHPALERETDHVGVSPHERDAHHPLLP